MGPLIYGGGDVRTGGLGGRRRWIRERVRVWFASTEQDFIRGRGSGSLVYIDERSRHQPGSVVPGKD
jgi:hypothetical protein